MQGVIVADPRRRLDEHGDMIDEIDKMGARLPRDPPRPCSRCSDPAQQTFPGPLPRPAVRPVEDLSSCTATCSRTSGARDRPDGGHRLSGYTREKIPIARRYRCRVDRWSRLPDGIMEISDDGLRTVSRVHGEAGCASSSDGSSHRARMRAGSPRATGAVVIGRGVRGSRARGITTGHAHQRPRRPTGLAVPARARDPVRRGLRSCGQRQADRHRPARRRHARVAAAAVSSCGPARQHGSTCPMTSSTTTPHPVPAGAVRRTAPPGVTLVTAMVSLVGRR